MKLDLTADQSRLHPRRVQLVEIDGGILLRRGNSQVQVSGEGVREVVEALLTTAADGGATVDELCDLFSPEMREEVQTLVRWLQERRFLEPSGERRNGSGPSPEDASDVFFWEFRTSAAEVARRLSECSFMVLGVNLVARRLVEALRGWGAGRVEVVDYPLLANLRLFDDAGLRREEWPASLGEPLDYAEWTRGVEERDFTCLVVTSDFGGQDGMRVWNEYCVRHGRHFLPVLLQDTVGWVGPLVIPGETPCLECLRARQNSHMEDPSVQRAVDAAAFVGQAVSGWVSSMASVLGDVAAFEMARFYGGWMRSRIPGRVVEVNLLATRMLDRRVLRVPRCAVCGAVEQRPPVSVDRDQFMPGNPLPVHGSH